MSIQIDKEFKELIPPLSADEYSLLEENILKEGIRDPLVVWSTPSGDILIDGHNRWEISAKHAGICFEIVKKEFKDREDVKEWIIRNQLGRRNIPLYVRTELALKLEPVIAGKAKERMLNPMQNSAQGTTRDQLARAAGVSHDTVDKVKKIQEKASDEAKEALRRGDISINAVYSGIMASENENKRQKEARELREAKKRIEEYEENKDEDVIDINAAKLNKADKKKLADNYLNEFTEAMHGIRYWACPSSISYGRFSQLIGCADKYQLRDIATKLANAHREILHLQRLVEERMEDEE